MLYYTLVFAPLIGALIAGFFGKKLGDTPAMAISTILLFLSAILSWVTLISVGFNGGGGDVTLFR